MQSVETKTTVQELRVILSPWTIRKIDGADLNKLVESGFKR